MWSEQRWGFHPIPSTQETHLVSSGDGKQWFTDEVRQEALWTKRLGDDLEFCG